MSGINRFKAYFLLARPHQFVKNAFVLLPLFFSHKLSDSAALLSAFYAFWAFSLCAAAIYSINDVCDVAEDLSHPEKKRRPVAAGLITPTQAFLFSVIMLAGALAMSGMVGRWDFILVLLTYFILNLLYCVVLKKIVLIDICCVGIGFVLRVVAGGIAISVPVSHWIIIVTFLLALFLALAKRRDDVLLACEKGLFVRYTVKLYNLEFISAAMVLMASVTVVSYIMYTVSPDVILLHGSDKLFLTGFWVVLGFLRYMQITFVENKSGSPTLILWKDLFLQLVLAAWLGSFFILLYLNGGM